MKVRQVMKPIMQISGKAKQVFKYIELLSQYQGKTTIRKLAQHNKTFKLDLRS